MSPSDDKNIAHRPGALKQQNKPFKSGRHRSQHEIKRNSKGSDRVMISDGSESTSF